MRITTSTSIRLSMQQRLCFNMSEIMWWGYLHSNGTLQLKRWFGDHKDYTEDCEGNDFVLQVVRPFAANSREKALEILETRLRVGYPTWRPIK
jgi:hypothetical protein